MSNGASEPGSTSLAEANFGSKASVWTALCCLAIIVALVLGVGLASNLVLRHLVQTVPLWLGIVLGFRHSQLTSWVALPLFLFWLILMALIWSYLLGFSRLFSGHYSLLEIAMTIVVGVASILGIASFTRARSPASAITKGSVFVLLAVFQWLCLRISFLPAIAHR